jgi:ribosome-associated toxin RatA of RatAB toxin-antitoxin module
MEKIIYSFSEIDLPCSEERALLFFKNIQDYPGRVSYSKSLNILKKTKNGLYKEMEVVLPDGKNYYSRSVVRFFHNSFRIRQVFGEIKNLSWRLSVYPLADGQCHVVSTHRFDHSNLKRWPKLTEMIKDIEEKLLRTAYEKINEANQEIVITGLGIITNQGAGKNLLLEGAKNYLSQKNKIFTAYSPHFDPSQILPLKYIGRTDRSNQLALAAVKEALEQSKLKNYLPEEVGIIVCNFLWVNYVEIDIMVLCILMIFFFLIY